VANDSRVEFANGASGVPEAVPPNGVVPAAVSASERQQGSAAYQAWYCWVAPEPHYISRIRKSPRLESAADQIAVQQQQPPQQHALSLSVACVCCFEPGLAAVFHCKRAGASCAGNLVESM
jgi:hypothetical protein